MNCEEYADLSEHERRLLDGLDRLGARTRHREAPPRLERRLVAAFRAETSLPPERLIHPFWAVGTWAAALVVTAGLGMLLVRSHEPQRTQRISHRATQLAVSESPVEPDFIESDLPADFIPLPNAERIAPNEPVNLVRLELPRSTMIALGLAGAVEHGEESVEADVMLGADGVARAVRFLE